MSKDTIYREDAIKAINLRARIPHDVASAQYASMAINAICSVPSADRPQGEWIIEIDINNYTYGRCSICGMRQYAGHLNFCPNCGADMRGKDDGRIVD